MLDLMVDASRRCRKCGCSELNACYGAETGACWWVEPDLCSRCAGQQPDARGPECTECYGAGTVLLLGQEEECPLCHGRA